MADRLTSTKKRDLRAVRKEISPTPEPPIDSNDDEDDQTESQATHGEKINQGEINSDLAAEKDKAEPSNKGKEVANPAADEHVEVTSSEVFAGCKSIAKI